MTALVLALALGSLTARVEPAAVVFGERGAPRVELLVMDKDHRPVEGAKVRLVSSVGSFQPVKEMGGGRYRAQYVLPQVHLPQLALFAVDVEAPGLHEHTWLTLPLKARADLRIETKPLARVTAEVGATRFGPSTADRSGHVTVSAVIPPCVATATVHAIDAAGNSSERPLDLKPQPFPHALMAPQRDRVSWADPQPTSVEVFAVDAQCAPLTSAAGLSIVASSGTVSSPVPLGPGLFSVSYRPTTVVGKGASTLVVKAGPLSTPGELRLTLLPGPPDGLHFDFEPPSYVAGSGTPVRVHAFPADAHGNPVDGGAPPESLASDVGTLTGGPVDATFRPPDHFGGRDSALVRGTAGGKTSEAPLPLEASGPALLSDVQHPRFVRAGETYAAEIFVRDRFENPIPHAALQATVTGAEPASVTPLSTTGGYRVSAPVAANAPLGRGTMQVGTATGLSYEAPFELRPYQRPWGLVAGLELAGMTNFKHARALVPRLELGVHLGRSAFEVLVEGELAYYQSVLLPQAGTADGTRTFLKGSALGIGARYTLPLTARWSAHASVVVGGARVTDRLTATVGTATLSQSEELATLLIRAALGGSVALGPGRLFLQLEVSDEPVRGQVQGNLGGLGLALGYLFDF